MSGSLVVPQRVMIFVAFLAHITNKSRRIGFVMIVLHMSSTVGLVAKLFPTFCTNESSIGFDHKVVNSWRKLDGYMYMFQQLFNKQGKTLKISNGWIH